ncbi:MAG: molybdopterin-guanine dinucleotide biosynthesis protein B [Proteobacteria bacterium]|nr:molybdopterin-guanine dinucleotide biosynthesis protein B [Pseudomonadota bacterium]
MTNKRIPVLSVVGRSKTGKTTLIEKLIPLLDSKGIKVAVIKHHHHDFEIDTPGKDTHRLKHAGAHTVIISSPKKIAIIQDTWREPSIEDIVSKYASNMDIVITEGYKKADMPKIEVYQKKKNLPPVCIDDKNLLALVSDSPILASVPVFLRDDAEGILELILSRFTLSRALRD